MTLETPPYVIDVNTSFGKRVDTDSRYTLKALCEQLDKHHVACALCYSKQGKYYNPISGNDQAIAAGLDQRIVPVAVINPQIGLSAIEEINRCLSKGVRAFRIFPKTQDWLVRSAAFRAVLESLRGSGACLLVSSQECPTGWELPGEIAHITAEFGLPVVLTDTAYGNMAEVLAVLRAYPHVYAETSWLATVDAINVAIEAVGSDRLLYGSFAPACPMQKSLNQVLESDISDEEKRAILGGNAMRLFGISPANLTGRPQLDSLEPKNFSEEIIDVHSHLGYWALPLFNDDYDPTAMLRRMQHFGVTHSVVSTYESMRYDLAAGNARLAKAIEGHPKLLGYVELNPYDLKLSCAEMDKYYALPNFVGCEVELTHIPCPTGSPKMHLLMSEIAKRGKPVLFMPNSAYDAVYERELARENPELIIVHAHGFDPAWAKVVQDTPNINVEFNCSRPCHLDARDCIDILGPERVLFGSDQTLLTLGGMIGLYLDMNLNSEERSFVLNENARRLYKLS